MDPAVEHGARRGHPAEHEGLGRSRPGALDALGGGWAAPLLATRDAVAVLLKLLRDSGKSNTFTARQGAFQQMSGGKVVHLIRVSIDRKLGVAPEVSANKYAVNVRFIEPTTHSARSRASTDDIPFTLAFCKL